MATGRRRAVAVVVGAAVVGVASTTVGAGGASGIPTAHAGNDRTPTVAGLSLADSAPQWQVDDQEGTALPPSPASIRRLTLAQRHAATITPRLSTTTPAVPAGAPLPAFQAGD